MKKLTIWGIVLLVLYILVFYIPHNLSYYSIYYATNIPHREGTNPVLVMVANNMDTIKLPEDNYELIKSGGFGGPSTLERKKDPFVGIILFSDGINVSKLYTTMVFDDVSGEYKKDRMYDEHLARYVPLGALQKIIFLMEMKVFLSDIVAVQEEPSINLQWLFNSLNESKFN
ncbi:hypothetical protein NHG24_02240 [Aerococcaceae bacterium NML210727]|nr:hypothetical protein [Aerococcaceae bacterium NML210727]MCW6653964.1 hypothetical protein [Aerococcaceae bacterium NML201296]